MLFHERWSFHDDPQGPALVTTWVAATEMERAMALPRSAARRQMERLSFGWRDDDHRDALIALCEAIGEATFDRESQAPRFFLDRVLVALERGLLIMTGDRGRPTPAAGGAPAAPAKRPEPAKKANPPLLQEPLSWIEIRIASDKKKRYAGRVKIQFPNGQSTEVSTNGDGILRFDGLLPGDCQLTLLDPEPALSG